MSNTLGAKEPVKQAMLDIACCACGFEFQRTASQARAALCPDCGVLLHVWVKRCCCGEVLKTMRYKTWHKEQVEKARKEQEAAQ